MSKRGASRAAVTGTVSGRAGSGPSSLTRRGSGATLADAECQVTAPAESRLIVESPIGGVAARIDLLEGAIRSIWWPVPVETGLSLDALANLGSAAALRAGRALADGLAAYFARDFKAAARAFAKIGPTPPGPTFQHACWDACRRTVAAGEVITYGELAERAGGDSHRHARAAGQAMRHNPWGLIIPCHRVIGSARDLHGYGGKTDLVGPSLNMKRQLLMHEGMTVDERGRVREAPTSATLFSS